MALQEFKVWGTTTRVFHWVNVFCVLGLIAFGVVILNADALGIGNDGKVLLKTGHVYIGYVFALNLVWRLVWGFIGGPYARWRATLPLGRGYSKSLGDELNRLRTGQPAGYIGHTPLGRIAVTVILLVLTCQAITGLILAGTDVYMPPFGGAIAEWVAAPGLDPSQVRPYAPETVDPAAYQAMRDLRAPVIETHEIVFFVILALIALHILAVVLTELKHGGTIISAMITGRKTFREPPVDVPE